MLILATRDSWWMTQCEAALLAEGVDMRWLPWGDGRAMVLEVPDAAAEQASLVLSELLAEELRQEPKAAPLRLQPLLLQPAFAFAAGMALLTLSFFWVTGATAARGEWQTHGAFVAGLVERGEWWRVITAATLHADGSHALGNAGFFLLLGWAASERLGPGVAALAWLTTAVVGFAVTLVATDTVVSVGASGGLFGLLGAAGGHAMRYWRSAELQRRGRVRALGGALLLLSFTAFSPQSNIGAHLGGFACGILVGAAAPRSPAGKPVQLTAGLTCMALVVAAWWRALPSGAG